MEINGCVDIVSSQQTSTVDIKVRKFSLRSTEVGKSTFSPKFLAGGHCWRLVMDIGGSKPENKDYISCFLQCTSVGSVKASFKLSLVDQTDGGTYINIGHFEKESRLFERNVPLANDGDWSGYVGCHKFVPRSIIANKKDKYLVHDCLVIRVKISCDDCTIGERSDPIKIAKYDLSSLRNDDETTDFSIHVQSENSDRAIKVHKLVLSAFSEVFKSMAYGPMKEAQSNSLVIDDFSVDAVETMVSFFYHGELSRVLDTTLVLELLSLSCKYQIETLKSRCSQHLMATMSNADALCILSAVDVLSLSELKEMTLTFVAENFAEIGTVHADLLYDIEKHLLAEILKTIAAQIKSEQN